MRLQIKIFALLFLLFSPVLSFAGNDQANGGDAYALEFVDTAEQVVFFLKHNGSTDIDTNKLESTVKHVKVESTTQSLLLNTVPKDALNYPNENRIVFNRQRWNQLDNGQKTALVLHEYLSIMGIEDANYTFSKKVLGSFTYGINYYVDCDITSGEGDMNFGIDESYGVDVILLSINFKDELKKGLGGEADRPLGEYSQMIRDGNLMIAFGEEDQPVKTYLVALKATTIPHQMTGYVAAEGKVYPLSCMVRKAPQIPDDMN